MKKVSTLSAAIYNMINTNNRPSGPMVAGVVNCKTIANNTTATIPLIAINFPAIPSLYQKIKCARVASSSVSMQLSTAKKTIGCVIVTNCHSRRLTAPGKPGAYRFYISIPRSIRYGIGTHLYALPYKRMFGGASIAPTQNIDKKVRGLQV